MSTPPCALLMDIDGTLLDSVEAQSAAWLEVLQDFGYPVELSQLRPRIGLGQDRILRELCGVSEASPRARRLLALRESLLLSHYLPKLSSFPAASEFIAGARSGGAQLAVVSGAHRSEALALLGAARLLTQFEHVVCREDVVNTKPAPDAVTLALHRMGVAPGRALFIASSTHDVAAARAAGVASVTLASGNWSAIAPRARAVAVTWNDLLERWQRESRAA